MRLVDQASVDVSEWLRSHPAGPGSWVSVDVETANRFRSSICSIGLAFVQDGEIVGGFHSLVQPEPFEFDPYNSYVHGIYPEDVAGAPTFAEVWAQIDELLRGRTVLAHNAGFDVGALRLALSIHDVEFTEFGYYCTRLLSKKAWPQLPSYALGYIADHCQITFEHHDAFDDARACAEVALRCVETLGGKTLDEIATSHAFRRGQVFRGGYSPSIMKHWSRSSRGMVDQDGPNDENHPFFDRTVVFTGTLQSMVRRDAMQLVVNVGGVCTSSVSKNTSFLVVGDQDYSKFRDGLMSNKMRTAASLLEEGVDIEIVSEREFLRLLEGV